MSANKKNKKSKPISVDEYALRAMRKLPPSQKSSIATQTLMRFKVYQHPEHAEALKYIQNLPRGEVYDTIVRALLLYRDYEEALNGLEDTRGLRDWTIQELLDEAGRLEEGDE